eukprot:m.243507 g.243507  ORF g.243507 m.243507 type:complete len:540 (-) comp22549_c9_seq1:255-1874(-)
MIKASLVLLVLGVCLGLSVSAEETFCFPQNSKYTIRTRADAASFPTGCTYVEGSVEIICTPNAATGGAGGINSLSFLSNVHYINGYLLIQDCDVLPSLSGLEKLDTIAGSVTLGLKIWNNDLLTNIKPLDNLDTIKYGGVDIFHNDQLCYLDLYKFDRIVSSTEQIKFAMNPTGCSALKCDGSCSCGWCGGPGECTHTCDDKSIAWIAAPIILGVLLLGLLIFLCYRWRQQGKLGCDCYCSFTKPLPKTAGQTNKIKPAGYQQLYNGNRAMGLQPLVPPLRQPPVAPQQQQQKPQQQAVYQNVPTPAGLPRLSLEQRQRFESGTPAPAVAQNLPPNTAAQAGADSPCICGKPAEFDCSRCGKKGYCSAECQRQDWRSHRDDCRRFSRVSRARMASPQPGNHGSCSVCGKPAEFECSRCNGPSYCSATCQRSHWAVHASECKSVAAAPNSLPDTAVGDAVQAAATSNSPKSSPSRRASAAASDNKEPETVLPGATEASAAAATTAAVATAATRPLSSVPEERRSTASASTAHAALDEEQV